MRRACGLAWQAETQKLGDFGFLSREKRRKRVILIFSLGRNAKNGRFCVSLTSDGQKLGDSAFRLRAKSRNWVILRFAYERWAVFSDFYKKSIPKVQEKAK